MKPQSHTGGWVGSGRRRGHMPPRILSKIKVFSWHLAWNLLNFIKIFPFWGLNKVKVDILFSLYFRGGGMSLCLSGGFTPCRHLKAIFRARTCNCRPYNLFSPVMTIT